ncbi:MAG: succinate dehydrogenase, hydrophobic membrane anchor protein [Hyphomicrobiales bacterium]|jgi:succinate dehydrogenase / fumarate reductase, membrane anchor subunit|nr:succinate dehydrogenase, hydrophobic membrane anchor protein [Hyphomicrobiales bacterium]|tara:strand:+ start:26 stop:388 length:363 start_codon:yes stop_codon:yes gene_type:complete
MSKEINNKSQKHATRHFIAQRITALLNIPLSIFLLYLIFNLPNMTYADVIELFQKPLVTILTIFLVLNFSYHMKLGMQIVIEDYIHEKKNLKMSYILNNLLTSIVIIGSLYSIIVIFLKV